MVAYNIRFKIPAKEILCYSVLSISLSFLSSCQNEQTSEQSDIQKIIGRDERVIIKKPPKWIGEFGLKGMVSHCTGFSVSPYEVLTAGHCYLSGTSEDMYQFIAGGQHFEVESVKKYENSDLLVLQIKRGRELPGFIAVSDETSPRSNGDKKPWIISFDPGSGKFMTSKVGDLSLIRESGGEPSGVFTHNLDTLKGSSGSPVISDGKVIGVHLGSLSGQNLNYGVLPALKEQALLSRHLDGLVTEYSFFDDLLFGGAILLSNHISWGVSGVSSLVTDAVKPIVIRRALKSYLSDIDLPSAVKERLIRHIDSAQMTEQIVPFLMTMAQVFQVPESFKHMGFDDYVRSNYDKDDAPGMRHSLFSWDEKDKSGSGVSPALALDKNILSKVLLVYDALFLLNPEFKPGNETVVSESVLQTVTPVIRDIIEQLGSLDGGDHAIKDIIAGMKDLLEDSDKLEAASHSLATFIYRNFYKYYDMTTKRGERLSAHQQQLSQWLQEKSPKLWTRLESLRDKNKYAVHVLVDGLQGHLMQGLAHPDDHKTFLTKILDEQIHFDQFRPEVPSELVMAPEQHFEFLKFLGEQGYQDSKYLPFFKQLYRNDQGGLIRQGVSTTPTISVRNLPIAQTGAPVTGIGSTGLPNFHFVDRAEDRAYYFYGNDSLDLEVITHRNGMKTVAERLEGRSTMNCFGSYDRGFSYLFDPLLNLALGESVRDFGEKLCMGDLDRRAKNQKLLYAKIDEIMGMKDLLMSESHWYDFMFPGKSIQKQNAEYLLVEIARLAEDSLPEYLHYYNPWPDHFAHFTGPFSDEILAPNGELNRLDYWLGILSGIYEDAGLTSRTIYGMSGDHGLAPIWYIAAPVKELEEYLGTQGVSLISEKISSDEGEGPRISHPTRFRSMGQKDLVYASTAGGNLMMDFFVDQGENWARQPVYQELVELNTLDGHVINIPEVLLTVLGDSLDYLVLREKNPGDSESVTRVMGVKKGRHVSELIYRVADRYFYEGDSDLLKLLTISPYSSQSDLSGYRRLLKKCKTDASLSNPGTWCRRDEWAELTSYTVKPDSLVQVSHLSDSDLAGTVNLFPADGIGYNTKVPGRHAGEHFHEKDAFLGFWGAGSEGVRSARTAEIGSVPATICQFLTGSETCGVGPAMGYPGLLR